MPPFNQPPPCLGNQWRTDHVLQSYLRRTLPNDLLASMTPALDELGERAGGEWYAFQLRDRQNEPRLTQWDAWGNRIDHLEVSPLWREAERWAAEYGIVAAAYEDGYAPYARVYQFALAYLFHPSTDVYTCPLAMTDGAARTLLASNNRALIDRAVPRLTSRHPNDFWTSGQWMTESTGGSDVGTTETEARLDNGQWRLYGRKWFTSAAASQMTLTLARPEGNRPGGKGLAMFYLEPRGPDGRLQNIRILRLKDKLGTRKVPTAELLLEGAPAELVGERENGVRAMVPMLQTTRTWNSVTACAFMRRGLALAGDYAARRRAFGAPLSEKPLHIDTLAGLQAEAAAAFLLTFFLVERLGKEESEHLAPAEDALFRALTSIVKLTTAKQAAAVASEVIECCGGAGYVEDTGLPLLLRDSQVLPIWEGTTNVLSLDTLRAAAGPGIVEAYQQRFQDALRSATDTELRRAAKAVDAAAAGAWTWLAQAQDSGIDVLEAGARRFAVTLGRSLAAALLIEHAQWALDQEADPFFRAAALRFVAQQPAPPIWIASDWTHALTAPICPTPTTDRV